VHRAALEVEGRTRQSLLCPRLGRQLYVNISSGARALSRIEYVHAVSDKFKSLKQAHNIILVT
jgi:hypothetical protein